MEGIARYTHEDVMQAIACALAFADTGVGLGAQDVMQCATDDRPSNWGIAPDRYGATLMPGCGITIHLSGAAMGLLAEAQDQLESRTEVMAVTRGGLSIYDLRRGAGERGPSTA